MVGRGVGGACAGFRQGFGLTCGVARVPRSPRPAPVVKARWWGRGVSVMSSGFRVERSARVLACKFVANQGGWLVDLHRSCNISGTTRDQTPGLETIPAASARASGRRPVPASRSPGGWALGRWWPGTA